MNINLRENRFYLQVVGFVTLFFGLIAVLWVASPGPSNSGNAQKNANSTRTALALTERALGAFPYFHSSHSDCFQDCYNNSHRHPHAHADILENPNSLSNRHRTDKRTQPRKFRCTNACATRRERFNETSSHQSAAN